MSSPSSPSLVPEQFVVKVLEIVAYIGRLGLPIANTLTHTFFEVDMTIRYINIETTGTVAIGRIDVLRMHAAGIFVAPAIAEFCGCRCLRNQTEVFFFGAWDDVKRAHLMLAMIRSAMDREFAAFVRTHTASGAHPGSLAVSFSKGMGDRISHRLRLLKAGRTANVLARGKDLAAAPAKLFRGALNRAGPHKPSSSMIAHAAGVEAGGRAELTPRDLKALPKPSAMATP